MTFFLVEDDHLQAEWLHQELEREFRDATVEVIPTESGFRELMDDVQDRRPDVVIMDVMLRWTDPGPEMPEPPADVKGDGYFLAGIRCAKLLADHHIEVPVILYSVLDENDLAKDLPRVHTAGYLPKGSDLNPLFRKIRTAIKGRRE